jgi:phospho-N-acetylmuramoyl-pentapeptide-transferase
VIRLLIAAGVALGISLVGTHAFITWLTRHHIGQPIREDGPQGHVTKAGTPTMGGLVIVVAAFAGWVVSDIYNGVYTRTGILVMFAILGGGAVGLMDDWIKVVRERSLGLSKRAKFFGLIAVATIFGISMVKFTAVNTHISFTRPTTFDLTKTGWVIFAVLLIVGSSNAVNLTDGLDGLAAGSAILCFSAYTVIPFWQFRHAEFFGVDHALDLSVISASMVGALVGFLWWNAAPARIFMGDTGSLAIGSGLAALALATDTQLLLGVVGGLFVMETASVVLQVARFRMARRRFFRMAPIHHHFELGGWPETTVIIRFWILSGLCTAGGLGIFYADSIAKGFTK